MSQKKQFEPNPFLHLRDKTIEFALNVIIKGEKAYAKSNGVMIPINGSITIQIERFSYPKGHVDSIPLTVELARRIQVHPTGEFDYQLLEEMA